MSLPGAPLAGPRGPKPRPAVTPRLVGELMALHRRLMKTQIWMASSLFLAGLAILAAAWLVGPLVPSEIQKTLGTVAASLVTTLSVAAFREALSRRERLVGLETLGRYLVAPPSEDAGRTQDLLWKLLEKSLLG